MFLLKITDLLDQNLTLTEYLLSRRTLKILVTNV